MKIYIPDERMPKLHCKVCDQVLRNDGQLYDNKILKVILRCPYKKRFDDKHDQEIVRVDRGGD